MTTEIEREIRTPVLPGCKQGSEVYSFILGVLAVNNYVLRVPDLSKHSLDYAKKSLFCACCDCEHPRCWPSRSSDATTKDLGLWLRYGSPSGD